MYDLRPRMHPDIELMLRDTNLSLTRSTQKAAHTASDAGYLDFLRLRDLHCPTDATILLLQAALKR